MSVPSGASPWHSPVLQGLSSTTDDATAGAAYDDGLPNPCLTNAVPPTHRPQRCAQCPPPVSSQAEEAKVAAVTFGALMMTTAFSQTAVSGEFKGVQPLNWNSIAATEALKYTCERLAMARRLTTTPSPEAATTYKDRIAAIWKHHGPKALRCGAPSSQQPGMSEPNSRAVRAVQPSPFRATPSWASRPLAHLSRRAHLRCLSNPNP